MSERSLPHRMEPPVRKKKRCRRKMGKQKMRTATLSSLGYLLIPFLSLTMVLGCSSDKLQIQPLDPRYEVFVNKVLPIQIRVVGNYHELGNFVSGVAALPRIVTLHNITLSPKGDTMVMTATAKTYRRLDETGGRK